MLAALAHRSGGSIVSVGPPSSSSSAAAAAAAGGGVARGGVGRGRRMTSSNNSGSSNNDNNIAGVLGTPPRLPRPVQDAMVVEAATEAARWLAVDDRAWHQVQLLHLEYCIIGRGGWRVEG